MKQIGGHLVFEGGRHPTLILAHGAGAPMTSPFMISLAEKISGAGFNVVLFEFDYMQRARREGRRLPPDRADKLLARWQSVAAQFGQNPLVLGGKSMGGRMASMLLAQNPALALGLLCFGYPFHPPGRPEVLRIDHLSRVTCPALICQGERDGLGNRAEIEAMTFPGNFEFCWLPDGDHSFKPRVKTGVSEEQNLAAAANRAVEFLEKLE